MLAVHQQRELKKALRDPEEGTGAPLKGLEAGWAPAHQQPERTEGEIQGPTVGVTPRSMANFFFFFLQIFLVERGKKLQIHIGQGSVGQQIKPENRLFELSGRKKDCPGTELK